MPIYEYRCGSCGHEFDALQKVADEPLLECPECNEAALKRLVSAPSFRLKGSGWYETDFKSDKERKRNLAEGSGEKSEKSEKSDKSEGKSGGESPKSESKEGAQSSKPKTSGDAAKGGKGKGTGTEAA